MTTVLNTLGVTNLALRGAGTEYHRISRVFRTLAEATAAQGSGDYVPTSGVLNMVLILGEGLRYWDFTTSTFKVVDTSIREKIAALTGTTQDDEHLGTFSGSTIPDSSTIKAALQTLETTLEAVDIDTDDLAALTGIAENITNLGTFTGATIADSQSVKQALQSLETATELRATIADVDQNEADADAAIALRATIDSPAFTTHAASPEWRASGTGHLKLRAVTGNDLNIYLADQETLQITRDPSTGDPKFTAKGGSGTFKFNQSAEFVSGLTVGGVAFSSNTAAVIGAGGAANLGTFTGATIADSQTIKQALQALETTLEAVDIDTDDLAALTGIAENVTNLGTFTGSTIADNVAVKTALQSLETYAEAVQADVDANEVTAAALAAANEVHIDNKATLLGLAKDSTHMGTFSGSTISDNVTVKAAIQALETYAEAVQADVNTNEADADTAIALRATIDDPTFTTKIESPEYHSVGTGHLKFRGGGNDIIFYPQDTETLQITRSGTDCRFTSNGGTGTFKFNQEVDLADGFKVGGTAITATAAQLNYVTGCSSAIQTQLDAIQADVNQNETDADAAIAAVQADVNQNETDADAAIAAVQADVDQNESDADTAIALRATIASPTFTGTPAAPTAAAATNTTQLATTAFVVAEIAATIDGAPGALNTLNELAAALGDDANFSTTITNLINANETHIDNVATLSGVAKDSANLGTFTGSTISDSVTIKAALQALETYAEAVQADVDSNETAAAALAAANEVHIDNKATLLGLAKDSTHMGTFTGSTISDNVTVKAAVQALETAVEDRLSTSLGGQLSGNLTLRKSDGSAVALVMSRQDHADMSCVWKIQPSYVSANKECLSVLAAGQPVLHFDERQRVSINKTDPDYVLDVGGDGYFSTNLTVGGTANLSGGLTNAADDTAAAAAGVAVNQLYRNGSVVMIRVS